MNGIKKEKQINECMHEKSKTNGWIWDKGK